MDGIRGCEGGPQGPSSLRAACGAPRARKTRASPRKWRGRAGSHALLQVFASYEEVIHGISREHDDFEKANKEICSHGSHNETVHSVCSRCS